MPKPKPYFKPFGQLEPKPSLCQPPRPDLDSMATFTVGGVTFECDVRDIEEKKFLGKGAYGHVVEVVHRPSNTTMAVKRIMASTGIEQKRLLMDLDIIKNSVSCEFTVEFYGALFKEGEILICMEVMDASLDNVYRKLNANNEYIPEVVIATIARATTQALMYLHKEMKVIHRDVKPSNILVNRKGAVKICDFGVSGYLVDSTVKSRNAGAQAYMAPEKIDPLEAGNGYGVKSDVWSLGITLIELATGKFPYPKLDSIFQLLKQVVTGESPKLPADQFSADFCDFVAKCLNKKPRERANYQQLLEHPFLHPAADVNMAEYVTSVIDKQKM